MMKRLVLGMVGMLVLISVVSALGVVAPYWNKGGTYHPLIMEPGTTKTIFFTLQNADKETAVIKAELKEGEEIATLTGSRFVVKPGGQVKVPVVISVPNKKDIKYAVEIEFSEATNENEFGGVSINRAFTQSFDVIVKEPEKKKEAPVEEKKEKPVVQQPQPQPNVAPYLLIALLILVLVVLIVIYLQNQKRVERVGVNRRASRRR